MHLFRIRQQHTASILLCFTLFMSVAHLIYQIIHVKDLHKKVLQTSTIEDHAHIFLDNFMHKGQQITTQLIPAPLVPELIYQDNLGTLKNVLELSSTPALKNRVEAIQSFRIRILDPLESIINKQIDNDLPRARNIYIEKYRPQYLLQLQMAHDLTTALSQELSIREQTFHRHIQILILSAIWVIVLLLFCCFFYLYTQKPKTSPMQRYFKALLNTSNTCFFFQENGEITQKSAGLLQQLPHITDHSSVIDVLSQHSTKSREDIQAAIHLLWSDPQVFLSDFTSASSLLPKQVGEHIHVSYHPLYEDNHLSEILVILKDLSHEAEVDQSLARQAERVTRISKCATHLESFRDFEKEAHHLIESIDDRIFRIQQADILRNVRRDLHTLKGALSTYDFLSIAEKINQLEFLLERQEHQKTKAPQTLWKEIYKSWRFEIKDMMIVLGLTQKEAYIEVRKSQLQELKQYAEQQNNQELCAIVHKFEEYPLHTLCKKYESYLEKTTKHSNKKIHLNYQNCDDIHLQDFRKIDPILNHILRNCLSHGIEDAHTRQQHGKPEIGSIAITTTKTSEYLQVIIQDDGRGIQGDQLARKAVEGDIWSQNQANAATQQEKIDLIFDDRITTSETTSLVSGRGIGMHAVLEHVKNLEGSLQVTSTPQQGSAFHIHIPLTPVSRPQETFQETFHQYIAPEKKLHIVILDDEIELLHMMEDVLKSYGYQLDVYTDPEEALDKIQKKKPDAIIVDYFMPTMDGIEFTRQLQHTAGYEGPVIMCSGYSAHSFIKENSTLFTHILEKPFQFEELAQLLSDVTSPK